MKMLEKSPSNRPGIKEISTIFKINNDKLKKNTWDLDNSQLDFKEFLRPNFQQFEIKNEKIRRIQEKVLKEHFLDFSPRVNSFPSIKKSDIQQDNDYDFTRVLNDSITLVEEPKNYTEQMKDNLSNEKVKNHLITFYFTNFF